MRNFIRMGGSLPVLQKLMGHSKISMMMKYVHVDENMKQAEIDRMDALDGQNMLAFNKTFQATR